MTRILLTIWTVYNFQQAQRTVVNVNLSRRTEKNQSTKLFVSHFLYKGRAHSLHKTHIQTCF